jgi:carotenoid cleavage dioxygenase
VETNELALVDPSTIPHLSGRFAPVHREITSSDIEVEGAVPSDLVGAYVRNGPNPRFTPLGSYLYPMEGDGMLHGVWFGADGGLRYRNRWVRTAGMRAEERAGRALFGGLMTPAFVDPARLGDDPDPGWPNRLDAFIHIVRHAGRYLALEEGLPGYEVTPELDTIRRYDFDGGLPKGMCAHPKIDPATGEMVVFRYDIEAPFLTWAVVGADGTVTRPETVVEGVDRGFMIHDFAITEHHLVLTVAPAVFDLDAMLAGGDMLAWKSELGVRVAVIARDGSATHWFEHDPYWVWHYANAYETNDTVRMDFPAWNVPGFLVPDTTVTGAYQRAVFDLAAGTMELETLHDGMSEFPRIDDRRIGQEHRYVLVTSGSGQLDVVPGEHDVLGRVDVQTGERLEYPTGGIVGEPVFAPKPGATDELDGYYVAFVNALDAGHTTLDVWDARAFPAPPVARLHLPQRVPNGLHGNWFAAG